MSNRHEGKVAFITGAGSGIGRETALRLSSEGAKMVITDVNLDAAGETVAQIEAAGGAAIAAQVDVRNRAQIAAAADAAVEAWGAIHLLINNAGLVTNHSLADLTEDAWDLVVDVNLKGQFLVAQEVSQRIAAAGGLQIGEILVADGVSPPVMLTDDAETDFLYQG